MRNGPGVENMVGQQAERVVGAALPVPFVSAWCGSPWHDTPVCTLGDARKLAVCGPSNGIGNPVAQRETVASGASGLRTSRREHARAESGRPPPGPVCGAHLFGWRRRQCHV